MTDYNQYRLSKKEGILLLCGIISGLLVIGILFFDNVLPVVFSVFVYKPARVFVQDVFCRKRRRELRIQFKDLLYSLSSSFSTGRHLREGLEDAVEKLGQIYGDDSYIVGEVSYILARMRLSGETEVQVLEDFARRAGIEEVTDFVQVYSACRKTGGNITASINKSAIMLGEKIVVEQGIEKMAGQKRYEGRIIAVMPIAVILFLRCFSPGYLNIMYTSLAGRFIMGAALAGFVIAFHMIERMSRIEV